MNLHSRGCPPQERSASRKTPSWRSGSVRTPRTKSGTVKLRLPAVFDAQHGGFATGLSPVSWGSIDELFVNLTMPLVSLAEARDVAFAHRKQARAGGDPLTEQRHAPHVPTVEEAAALVLEQQRPGWRHARYERDWPRGPARCA